MADRLQNFDRSFCAGLCAAYYSNAQFHKWLCWYILRNMVKYLPFQLRSANPSSNGSTVQASHSFTSVLFATMLPIIQWYYIRKEMAATAHIEINRKIGCVLEISVQKVIRVISLIGCLCNDCSVLHMLLKAQKRFFRFTEIAVVRSRSEIESEQDLNRVTFLYLRDNN